ncbi:MAG: 3-phosphoshikimate 1-carboxyvinyltransferase [Thermodesulfovibrionaceae bacterium]
MERVIEKAKFLKGRINPPADKSISHRAIMFASLAKGISRIRNFLWAKDPLSTLNAMRALKVEIETNFEGEILIHGKGLNSLKEPEDVIDCGNSGTTIRLLSGILSGQPFLSILTGDESLRGRPMRRVINPLRMMGADIMARADDNFPPIAIKGSKLRGIDYKLDIASAQVKSAILLAGLFAEGVTTVTEPQKSRDHTERMLKGMGVDIQIKDNTITLNPPERLNPFDIHIPNDFSSAAFFIAAATVVPNSEVLIENVCLNPTRTGFLRVVKEMGAQIETVNLHEQSGEVVGDIICKTTSSLKSVTVKGDIIPVLIDEFPVLCVLATQAEGQTIIRDAKELRVKESDRIKAMATELKKMGADIEELEDGVIVRGPTKLKGSEVYSYKDHRVAMALSVAGLIAEGSTTVQDAHCVDISFPEFYNLLQRLQR